MDPLGVVVAAVVGAVAGWAVAPVADRIATPRYGTGSPGHDPEDLELALLDIPTSRRVQIGAAAVVGLCFALLAAEFGELAVWAFFAVLTWAYVVAAVVDLQYLRLPDVITLPSAAVAVAGSLALAAEYADVEAAWYGAVAAVAVTVVLWLFSLLFMVVRGKEAFGLGDVKLQVSLGASAGWLGWSEEFPAGGPVTVVIWVALAGFLVGSLAGLPAAGFRMSKSIPFGPFLMVGWFVVVLLADSLRR
jgi:leader peptidase (prepilin peptidase)/N-methyltransferase